MESGQNEPISNAIHKYKDPIGAVSNVYLKSELFYEMLRFVVGDSVFKASLREVVRRYAFTHIKESDMMAVFEEVYGQDLEWFFEQWLHDTPTVDYTKGKVKKYKRDDKTWVTEVEIKRKGDGIMPVEVELDIGKGQKVVKRWDGKEESGTVVFETPEKPKDVKVDPDNRIMDSNRLNNQTLRLEFRPDFPLLKFIHMPADAILVLWRPLIDFNPHDGVRLGLRTNSSYRAFYNNLTLEAMFGFESKEFDGKVAYSNPLSRKSLLNRYYLMVRKNEGRFESDVHLEFKGSSGILGDSGRRLKFGLNYSDLLNDVYTFRKVANDTGKVRFDEWEDRNILLAYVEGHLRFGAGKLENKTRVRFQSALPGGDLQFTKLSGRIETGYQRFGFRGKIRGNLATSFGPDRLPLQDQFRAEGAAPRERFQNDMVKTGDAWSSFTHRYVAGGGYLRGYAGQPLPAKRYATINLEFGPARTFFIFKLFGFYDMGRIWGIQDSQSFTRSDAGFGLSFLGEGFNLFGGNLSLFSKLSAKLFFPLWLSEPPPGEAKRQLRWYFSLGKGL
ncbi:MAG: M1 family aminopeptidase [bacterium]